MNPFEVVFNDDYLLVVNKIAKVLIQPATRKGEITLTSLIEQKLSYKVFPCHRLDRETSGLVIYAKDRETQEKIMLKFKERSIEKKYYAFVKGTLKKKRALLSDYIIDRQGMMFGEKKKRAETFYKVLREFKNWSSVELKPLTGRTNQLRIQLAKIGHPILGEDKYAFRRDFKVKFQRLALHAYYLSFVNPRDGKRQSIKIGLPMDMEEFLRKEEEG